MSGKNREFHRELLKLTYRNIKAVDKLCAEYHVEYKALSRYRDAAERQLKKEAFIVFTKPRKASESETVIDIYESISDLFKELKLKRNDTLASQLTALLCSPPSCIPDNALDPSPAAVAKVIRRRLKRH